MRLSQYECRVLQDETFHYSKNTLAEKAVTLSTTVFIKKKKLHTTTTPYKNIPHDLWYCLVTVDTKKMLNLHFSSEQATLYKTNVSWKCTSLCG